MSADRHLDRLIQSFLAEGPLELPEPSYLQVRDRIESVRLRVVIGSWRTLRVSNVLKYGLVAAAAVLIALVGYQLFGNNVGSPGLTPTAQPTPTPEASQPEPSAARVTLPVGSTFDFASRDDTLRMPATIPATGWVGTFGNGFIFKNDNPSPPGGAGIITFQGDLYVYGDPCKWSTTRPDTPATTVDELVAAVTAQASRDASAAVDVTVDGYRGKSITLHVPDHIAFSGEKFTDCDEGYFASWGAPRADPARFSQGPGAIDELWILDVHGVLVVIDTAYYAGTPAKYVDELRAIVASITFR